MVSLAMCEQQSPPPFNCVLVRMGGQVPHPKLTIHECKYIPIEVREMM